MQRKCTQSAQSEREARARRIVAECRAHFAARALPSTQPGPAARCVRGLRNRHPVRNAYRRGAAADILCVSEPTFDRLVADGRIGVGPDGLVPREEIERYFGGALWHDVPPGWEAA